MGGAPERGLDSQLWHACAGGMVQLPSVGAKVIYFPQGHGEQAATSPDFPRSLSPAGGTIACRVTSVHFLADTETDEVYARMMLQPEGMLGSGGEEHPQQHTRPASPAPEKPASFAKTLTQSDANNGGGFSVPRYCAETIFPPLDYSVDPPVQTVLAKDVHGDTWKFRHIYRGTPRRHLLTTGWSTFVNQKKLVAGDAIVFLRSATGELCVGVRRSMRGATGGGDASSWHSSSAAATANGVPTSHRPTRWEVKAAPGGPGGGSDTSFGAAEFLVDNNAGVGRGGGAHHHSTASASSFARNRARVTAKSVLEAASLAAAGHPFEVVYYPRASTAEFCVKAHVVKAALDHQWYAGMRFKMAFETEDSSRISWFMGTIAAVQAADPVLWPKSPWRVLQVTWDEPDLLRGVSRVSPWQVELVSTLPMQLPPFNLPRKKSRTSDYPLQVQGAMIAMHMPPLPNSVLGQMNGGWHGIADDIPAGMQEARQERLIDGAAAFPSLRGGKKVQALDTLFRQQDPAVGVMSGSNPNHGGGGLSLYPPTATGPLPLQQHHLNWSGVSSSKVTTTTTSLAAGAGGTTSQGAPASNGSSSTKSAPFVLFGQAIDLADKPKSVAGGTKQQHRQQDSGSSSDEQSVHNFTANSGSRARASSCDVSNGDQVVDHLQQQQQRYYPEQQAVGKDGGDHHHPSSLLGGAGGGGASISINNNNHNNNSMAGSKWVKEHGIFQAAAAAAGKASRGGVDRSVLDSFSHCKVFKDSEEVGRTVDLAIFSNYDELFMRLATMFSMDKLELQKNLVYRNSEGSTLQVGDEPYRNFVQSVRRLTILPDTGSWCAARS